jgi:hypothetical protein
MSEILPDKPVQSLWVNRWVDIQPSTLPLIARWVDIDQVAPPPIVERKSEPMVTPRGMVWLGFEPRCSRPSERDSNSSRPAL